MNLVQMILNLLGGDLFSKLAGMLGIRTDQAESAAKAAIPAMLGALVSQASTTEGARKLAAAVNDADEGILGNPAAALSQKGDSLIESGGGLLKSLLGGNMLSGLSSALSRFSGLGTTAITGLLGSLAPMILGFLKRQTKSTGADAASITRLLMGQKDNIAAAMPSGLASLLDNVPGMEDIAGAAQRTAAEAGDYVRAGTSKAANYAKSVSRTPAPNLSFLWWLVPLLALGAIALLWNRWRKDEEPPVAQRRTDVRDTARDTVDESKRVVAKKEVIDNAKSGVQTLTEEVTDVFSSATTALTDIEDAASARAAVPKLQELVTKLEGAQSSLRLLPAGQRTAVTNLIETGREKFLPLIDKVYAIPGVRGILKPVIDQLIAKLDEIAPAA
jgi:hypothetical protein